MEDAPAGRGAPGDASEPRRGDAPGTPSRPWAAAVPPPSGPRILPAVSAPTTTPSEARQLALFDLGGDPDPAPVPPSPGREGGDPGANDRTAPGEGRAQGSATAAAGRAAEDEASRRLARRLDPLLDGRLSSLVLTRNRTRILSVKPAPGEPGGLMLRIDAAFAEAPEAVLEAVAAWAVGRGARRRNALREIRRHYEASRGDEPPRPRRRRRTVLRPVGRTADLREVRDRLDRQYFGGALAVDITWGRASHGRRRSSGGTIHLGTYDFETRTVRIHRALDHPDTPRYVLEAVVFHELLHAAMPPVVVGGRRRLHPPELRERERRFPQHEKAERWLAANLRRLLRRR